VKSVVCVLYNNLFCMFHRFQLRVHQNWILPDSNLFVCYINDLICMFHRFQLRVHQYRILPDSDGRLSVQVITFTLHNYILNFFFLSLFFSSFFSLPIWIICLNVSVSIDLFRRSYGHITNRTARTVTLMNMAKVSDRPSKPIRQHQTC
jgi:hypothetical protein